MSRLLGGLLQKAQEMKSKVEEVRSQLANKTVEATSENAGVKVVSNCDKALVSIEIDPSLMVDRKKLEGELLKTVNEALARAGDVQKEAAKAAMKEAGIFLPGIF